MVDNQEEMEVAQDLRLKREYEEWMRGRYKLVADVKNMGLNYEWLYNKRVKSAVEERVMIKLMQQNKREMEKEKLREIRQNNKKLKSHRFEDTFYLKKECSKTTMEKNKKLLQKIQVQALPSAESSISNLLPINHAANSDVVQMKQDRRKIEYTTVGNQLVVRNENIRIPQELISRNELMRNVEHARQKVGIKKLTTESFLKSIRNESSENRDPLRDLINIYPNFDDVIPEKEEMKLSTGQAFVEPKVNCWMTFEEMKEKLKNYGKDITPKMKHYILSRHAYWPGMSDNTRINYNNDDRSNSLFHHTRRMNRRRRCNYGYDNTRINYNNNDDRSNSLFHHTRRMNRRRCNYGYDNEINTWPVGDAIIYGDITRGRSYQIGWN